MIGSLIGGIFGKMGGDAAAASATQAAQEQREATAQAREDLSPWRTAGRSAVDEVLQLMGLGHLVTGADGMDTVDSSLRTNDQAAARGRFTADPGYAFRVAEGEKGLNRSLAAKTGTLNGAAVKAGARFNQDIASDEYGNYFNRMMGLVGPGASAAASSANVGVAGAKAAGDDLVAAGKARQSGYNALGTGLARGTSNLLNWFT